jgi:hypothetical protein
MTSPILEKERGVPHNVKETGGSSAHGGSAATGTWKFGVITLNLEHFQRRHPNRLAAILHETKIKKIDSSKPRETPLQ